MNLARSWERALPENGAAEGGGLEEENWAPAASALALCP